MSDIENAARAFDADIARETPSQAKTTPSPKIDRTEGPPERMFERVGELEIDEDSPPKGGGDDDPDPEVRTEDDDAEDVDAEEEGEEQEEETEDEDEIPDQEFNVIVDGKEQQVTLKEALEGYIRTQTFHQRMNEVEEAKTIIQRTAADAVANYEYSVNVAKQIEGYLEALVPPEPNWDEEFKKDPLRAREVQKYYDQVRGFRKTLQEQLGKAAEQQRKSQTVQLAAYAEEEGKKFDRANMKQWGADPKRKQRDLQAMRRTALTQGFSEAEISEVYDSRMLQILLKASRYDRMMASKPRPVAKAVNGGKPVPTGGGPARKKAVRNSYNQAAKRLNQTGSIEDAAVVFDQILRREK